MEEMRNGAHWCSYCHRPRHTKRDLRKTPRQNILYWKTNWGKDTGSGYKGFQTTLANVEDKTPALAEPATQNSEINNDDIDKITNLLAKLKQKDLVLLPKLVSTQ
ncbi:Uncharacterized protein Fot_10773 [Forsythia ovata]|uniref:Uncharacterized protein n=1 Tax=Forsythia ovata TaxID=205694 RepID=A0ABD1WKL8_9LAMI